MAQPESEKIDIDAIDASPATKSLLRQLSDLVASLQALVTDLRETIGEQRAEIAELKRSLFGQKSERVRMPPVSQDMARRKPASRGSGKEKRESTVKKKKELETVDVVHEVPAAQQECPACGGSSFSDLGSEDSFEYEFVPPRFIRRRHRRKKKACRCGSHIVTAPAPDRVVDGGQYGPRFYAHVVVAKCADVIPISRLATRLRREGVPISRSTMTDLFHRSAQLLRPIQKRLLELIAADEHVNADETSMRVLAQDECRRGYIWTFIAGKIVGYVYSPTRSGETPERVLGDSTGVLQVDGYSGYNNVCVPRRRERAGCLAHCRRYFYKALETASDVARHAIQVIGALYEVEYDAADQGILGTAAHLALRTERSKPIMDQWHAWLSNEKPRHPPKSPIGRAISYTLNNWKELQLFLGDVKIRLDNNISEGMLRRIALGRRNFLFVGHDLAGENLAVLQSIVATCETNGVEPQEYIADMLIRVQDHPAKLIDELLPWNWRPPPRIEAVAGQSSPT